MHNFKSATEAKCEKISEMTFTGGMTPKEN